MKRMFLRFTALMAAMVMTMTAQAKTQDWGGRVIDEKGEPMLCERSITVTTKFRLRTGWND